MADFPSYNGDILKVLEEKIRPPMILLVNRPIFKKWGEIKTLSDKKNDIINHQ